MTDPIAIYPFTHQHVGFDTDLKLLLGGKGANLNRMALKMGFPVPEGFTITTGASHLHQGETDMNPILKSLVAVNIDRLNETTGRVFGDAKNPLLVSVRSGAPVSMPGMMETILNLGLNDKTVQGLAAQTNETFAYDSYRRFIQMYAVTVFDMPAEVFSQRYEAAKAFMAGAPLNIDILKKLIKHYKNVIKEAGHTLPQSVNKQLEGAILAVFRSWTADKAVMYREIEGIADDLGTAVNVQRMVFGNMNDASGTGVAFTRNPNTGEAERFGDFLVNAQGEDVVDGSHVTLPLSDMGTVFPEQYAQLETYMKDLEAEFSDMCDIEFTVEDGVLFMLQTRVGKRGPKAAELIATAMFDEGLITEDEAEKRIANIIKVEAGNDTDDGAWRLACTGVGAAPGIVNGIAAFNWERAVALEAEGKDVILIRPLTSPDDVRGMSKAVGIITGQGGLVSHAAVVARGWGKPCVVGCESASVWDASVFFGDTGDTVEEGGLVRINGETGEVFIR